MEGGSNLALPQSPPLCVRQTRRSALLVPRKVAAGMVFVDTAPVDLQTKLQNGCSCCGWTGDPFLVIRVLPDKLIKKTGSIWCVIDSTPGRRPSVIWIGEPGQQHLDHQLITYFADARKNWENLDAVQRAMDAHDAKVEADNRKTEAELIVGISEMVGRKVRKDGHFGN